MTTPTDDEIVAYVLAQDWGYGETAVRHALRLAREGLPVHADEATRLNNDLARCVGADERISLIRTFLAARDAEVDEMVAELVVAAKDAADYLGGHGLYGAGIGHRIDAALAKLERTLTPAPSRGI